MAADVTNSIAPPRPQPRRAVIKILGIGLLTSIVGAIPAISDRGHTLDDITHSLVLQLGLGVSFFLIILVFGMVSIQRSAEAGRSPWLPYWMMLAILFTAGMLAIMLPSISAHRLAVDLDARGIPAQARVVRHFTEACGKSGCLTKLEYAFHAGPTGQTFRGFVSEGNVSRGSNSEYEYAISTGTIPILYDKDRPDRSEVNWMNEVHQQSTEGIFSTTAKVLTTILIVFVSLLASLLYFGVRSSSLDQRGII